MPGRKSDEDVCRLWDALGRGMTLEQAAGVAGMSLPTARKYWRSGRMPSEMKEPRTVIGCKIPTWATDAFRSRCAVVSKCLLG